MKKPKQKKLHPLACCAEAEVTEFPQVWATPQGIEVRGTLAMISAVPKQPAAVREGIETIVTRKREKYYLVTFMMWSDLENWRKKYAAR
jgi:hypothetical protein